MGLVSATLLRSLAPICLLIAIAGLVMSIGEPYQIRVAYIFFINLTAVFALQIYMGGTGHASFGHAAFQGIAAYSVAILMTPLALKRLLIPDAPFGLAAVHLGAVPSILIALVLTGVIAYIVGLAISRLGGVAAEIATLAFLVIVHVIFTNWIELFRGPRAFYGIPSISNLYWGLGAAIIALLIAKLFRDSPYGVQLRAASDNLLAARAMGVPVERLRLLAWTLSGIVMGMAGILLATYLGTIAPSSFYFNQTFLIMAMLLLGGMRSVSGALCGTLVISIGSELTRSLESGPVIAGIDLPAMFGLTGFFLGAIIVLVMSFRREGLLGGEEFEDLFRQWKLKRKSAADETSADAPAKQEA
ncbi:branched-chain amino acid ABC transporter permease [Methyloligella sp. 2.7D]|uniref:branched-chain amino acid ABC transporter permease n=1 Tax=unclassified Methyloligella TaxID=2625955 RepID=UPI00157CB959|nr:branched-chain amino acid ABC transporter permease [Methyloligella sp. GL2]QKP77946.1 branched-chain amino acid ABC transporter permease [Methyloligella sp. GL2]